MSRAHRRALRSRQRRRMPRKRKHKKQAQRANSKARAASSPADTAGRSEGSGSGLGQPASRTIELREEQLVPRKQVVESGVVQVRTEVLSAARTLDVSVAREEVFVERAPVERRSAMRALGGQEVVVEIPEYGQQVSLQAYPIVTRELIVSKETVHETRDVTGTVRREVARVERTELPGPAGER
ncbi:MAG: YsnF/AvaK domain-containing protein [Chloroflexota bacterium]